MSRCSPPHVTLHIGGQDHPDSEPLIGQVTADIQSWPSEPLAAPWQCHSCPRWATLS